MDEKYLFSIVMAVYNTQAYVAEAIESVLGQTVGFAENVQLILVNDGSSDTSGKICESYRREYPKNIVYLEQENGGAASARNAGLAHAAGTYVNFLDSDDVLSANALKEVAVFFKSHEHEVNMVAIPPVFFERRSGLHLKYAEMGETNRVIDLRDEPANFVLSASSSFYKRCCFEGCRFDERLANGEDADLNFRLFRQNPCFGYVCEKGVVYHYRSRAARGSAIDTARDGNSQELALACLENLVASANGNLAEYEKEFFAYQLRAVLKDVRKDRFESAAYNRLVAQCRELASLLDLEFILHTSKIIDTNAKKQLFLNLKGTSFAECADKGVLDISHFNIDIKDVRFAEEFLTFDLTFHNYKCAFDVVVVDAQGTSFLPSKSADISSPFDARHGEFVLDRTHYRQFVLPHAVGEYSLCFADSRTNALVSPGEVRVPRKPPLMNTGRTLGVSRFGKKLFIAGSRLVVTQDRGGAFARGIETVLSLRKNEGITPWFRPFARKKKKYVVIMDRPNKAGDNGQALYEHIMQHGSKRLKSCTYFVLDKKSDGYASLPCKSHVLQPRSIKHKLVFLNTRLVYSSHNLPGFYIPFAFAGKHYADLLDYKFVWLQHGITQNDVAESANRLRVEDDCIVVATRKERLGFLESRYFYEPNQILLLGFPRYDKLESAPKRIITIAPT